MKHLSWPEGDDRAVSPVIGVMLMLSITLIIGALLSAFAGGAISMPSKTPQATILATYSKSDGMKITHMGGDPIPVSSTTVWVRPTASFGENATKYSWYIDKNHIMVDDSISWDSSPSFIAGDSVRIKDPAWVQMRADGTLEKDHDDSTLAFTSDGNVRKSFVIELHDGSGKMIGQSMVVITD